MYHVQGKLTHVFYARLAEWYAATTMLLVGYVLFTNVDLMVTVSQRSNAYKFMLSVTDQRTWAFICVWGGLIRLLILTINGAWRKSPHLRGISALLFCFVWYHIAVSFYEVFGLAFCAFMMIFILDFLNVIRSFGDARIADIIYKNKA